MKIKSVSTVLALNLYDTPSLIPIIIGVTKCGDLLLSNNQGPLRGNRHMRRLQLICHRIFIAHSRCVKHFCFWFHGMYNYQNDCLRKQEFPKGTLKSLVFSTGLRILVLKLNDGFFVKGGTISYSPPNAL